MTDVAETVTSNRTAIVTPAVTRQVVTFEAPVTTGQTITLNDVTTIAGASLLKLSDGTPVTCTVAGNVITVTGSVTAVVVEGQAVAS